MQEGIPYLRTPALSPDGRSLAFVYAYDIWLVDIAGGRAERLTAHPASNFNPHFSPDGTLLAFGSNRTGSSDVYVLPLNDAGDVRRLTYHGHYSAVEDWSHDGQYIYFTSDREHQGWAIYRVPLAGGTPALIHAAPYENLSDVLLSPDGQTLAFSIVRSRWWRRGPDSFSPSDIWLGPTTYVSPEQLAEATPVRKFAGSGTAAPYTGLNRWPLWAPDGNGLYFVSDRSGVENIWFQPLDDGDARQITHFTDGRLLWPTIARHQGNIVFERNWQLWALDPKSEECAPIPIHVRADTKATPVYVESRTRGFSELRLSPDGKKVAFVAHGEIFADFADKETDKERRQGASFRVTNTSAREGQINWTPDSRRLIYVSDRHGENEIYCYNFVTSAETRLTNDPAPKWKPCCSPDGKWIAYIRGDDAIYLLKLATGETYPFAQGHFIRNQSLAWSPDSNWLAYISHDAQFFSNVYVQHITETTSRQITFLSNVSSYNILWSPDGTFIVFTTGQYRMESQIARVDLRLPEPLFRETEFEKLFEETSKKQVPAPTDEKPAPDEQPPQKPEKDEQEPPSDSTVQQPDVSDTESEQGATVSDAASETEQQAEQNGPKPQTVEIMFAGIERRLRFLTPIQMDADAQAINHTSRDLLFRAMVADKVNIWCLPLDEPRQEQPLQQLTANSSSKRDIQFVPGGKHFYYLEDGQITIRKFPGGGDLTTLYVRSDVHIDFHEEKMQIFGEAWRLLRDTFYDPTYHGQDWQALREHFAPPVVGAQTHGDLTAIINLMVGELRASHLGNYWYSGWSGHDGYTGLLFDPVEHIERGHLRVAALVPDSPVTLVAEPPRVGEYLVAVDGEAITPQTNLDKLLQRTIGRRVRLCLAPKAESTEVREIAIRPVDGDDYSTLRYQAWVAANRAYVDSISNGRLGYVHVDEMSYGAYQQFLVDLNAEVYRKEGVILDIRYNSGGHISTFILDVLTRRNVIRGGFREHLLSDPYHLSGNRTLNKSTVLVTNEHSASDAEIFTEIYRRLGLGNVVGKPTAGRVIGTTAWWLLNGSYFRLPIFSYTTLEGENLEGTGRMVDIDVERVFAEWLTGQDRQLDAAVATLLRTLDSDADALE